MTYNGRESSTVKVHGANEKLVASFNVSYAPSVEFNRHTHTASLLSRSTLLTIPLDTIVEIISTFGLGTAAICDFCHNSLVISLGDPTLGPVC